MSLNRDDTVSLRHDVPPWGDTGPAGPVQVSSSSEAEST